MAARSASLGGRWLRAAAALDYRDIHVPPQYLNGQAQLARNLKREAEAAAALRV
jgi:anthraniloyl-CoA monooxygenase